VNHPAPCPNCSGTELIVIRPLETTNSVWCRACGMFGPDCKTRDEAVQRWNRLSNLAQAAENAELKQ
jgi:uncharacterized Zn finger protein